MKKLILALLPIVFAVNLNAQIGVHFKTMNTRANEWNDIISLNLFNPESAFSTGFEYGVDWWLRLKNYRIEWTPEVSYGTTKSTFYTTVENERTYEMKMLNFTLNNNIYIFDLKNPDCPRYGLQADIFKKGFFLQISPGITKFSQEFSIEGLQSEAETTTFKLGLGVGMDFVIANLISITPYAKINFYSNVLWENLKESHAAGSSAIPDSSSPIKQFTMGIRFGLRPKILRDD